MEISLNIYYEGKANFTILICNKKAIIYDCGTLNMGKWTTGKYLKYNFKQYLEEILKNEEILLIISHDDNDHINLLNYLVFFLWSVKKKKLVIVENTSKKIPKEGKLNSDNKEEITKEKINSYKIFFIQILILNQRSM